MSTKPESVLLSARGLTRRFGGLAAVNQVSLDLWRDRIHAVIGPNGAGKSTLTNLLSGDLPPSEGEVTLLGHAMTGSPAEAYSRRGLGRSYQKINICCSPPLSCCPPWFRRSAKRGKVSKTRS